MHEFSIALHGGAGTILKKNMTVELESKYIAELDRALTDAYLALEKGRSCVDAVELAVMILEDSPYFNAGKGSVFDATGGHEMDASIMEGNQLHAGAVSGISGVRNPIQLSRLVMEKSEHVMLAGRGAEEFGRKMKVEFRDDDYFFDQFRFDQWQRIKDSDTFQLDHSVENKDDKFGTVGAVAKDKYGNIAAATSTGGMTNKRFGRVGDSPIIGSGTYANNKTCAVSCTGSGEYFIRGVVAYDVSCLMEYKGYNLAEACHEVINKRLLEINGDGGLVAVDVQGNLALPFNTEGMYRGHWYAGDQKDVSIYK